jgi:hypothetical protein
VAGIGEDPINQQAVAGDANRKRFTVEQKGIEPKHCRAGRRGEDRVAGGVGTVLVDVDGELDQEGRNIGR